MVRLNLRLFVQYHVRPSHRGQDVAPGSRQHQQVPQSHRPHPHLHHDRGPQVQPEELSLHPRRHPDEARVQERYRREISEEDRGDHPETSEDGYLTKCPECKFPASRSELLKLVKDEVVCPMCVETLATSDIKVLTPSMLRSGNEEVEEKVDEEEEEDGRTVNTEIQKRREIHLLMSSLITEFCEIEECSFRVLPPGSNGSFIWI